MAMFGSAAVGPQNWGDALSLIGATLKDASPTSSGGNLDAARNLMFQRQMYMRQQQMLSQLPGLFGGQQAAAGGAQMAGAGAQASVMTDPGSGPTMKGPGEDGVPIGPAETAPTYAMPPQVSAPAQASSPDFRKLAATAAMYKSLGMDIGSPADYLKMGQPHIMVTPSGEAISDNDPSMVGKTFPGTEKNQIILRDARGNPTGVINLPGASQAAGETAGAVTGAQERAKAGWNLVDVPMSDGSTVKMPLAIAAPILAQRAAGVGGAAGGPGTSPGVAAAIGQTQTPAAAELAKARAATQGKNESDIAGARAARQQVDDQTNMIAQNLHDMLGETQDPQTGKWVKTKPSMIGHLSTGSATDIIEHIPFLNQDAKDLEAKIETVRNGTSFNSLQAIKNAMAAAGDGGSGSIRMTDQTARMLGEINGSLNQDQRGPQFEATVRRHISQLDALAKARHDMFESQYRGIRQTTPGQTAPTANYVPPAPRATEARAANTVYQTPKGPLKWTGTGWVQP